MSLPAQIAAALLEDDEIDPKDYAMGLPVRFMIVWKGPDEDRYFDGLSFSKYREDATVYATANKAEYAYRHHTGFWPVDDVVVMSVI